MEYVVIVIIICLILFFQIKVYKSTKCKLSSLRDVFPDLDTSEKENAEFEKKKKEIETRITHQEEELAFFSSSELEDDAASSLRDSLSNNYDELSELLKYHALILELKKDPDSGIVCGVETIHQNTHFLSIIRTVSNYLENNKGGIADYHLIKDIVDRNGEAVEDEINTQIPMPLYFGLMGTMAGILVGVGFLVISGGLQSLLDSASSQASGSAGIETLLGGVALAMIASILGIVLTTIGSAKFKDAKVEFERKKNSFLSWLQVNLLPQLSSDAASALQRLAENLKGFNDSFSSNTVNLKHTLNAVDAVSKGQSSLIDKIEHLNIGKIAFANIDVYERLKNCTEEIGAFSQYINGINQYISEVHSLSGKLGDAEARVRGIEEMAAFFRDERSNLDVMKGLISKVVGETNEKFETALKELTESTAGQISSFSQHLNAQNDKLKAVLDGQQRELEQTLSNTNTKIDEMMQAKLDLAGSTDMQINLSPIEKMLMEFAESVAEQNSALNMIIGLLTKHRECDSDYLSKWNVFFNKTKDGLIVAACFFVCLICVLGITMMIFGID